MSDDAIRKALRLFRSVILSGEDWSDECQRAFEAALSAALTRPPSAGEAEPVAWMLKTGHGTGLRDTPPPAEVLHMWTPLVPQGAAPTSGAPE